MNINVADAIKISTTKLQMLDEWTDEDTIEIRDAQNNLLWKYVEQVPQNQNLIFWTNRNNYITEQSAYTAFPTYYVDVTKQNIFYKYMSYTGTGSANGNIWFDGTNIYCNNWKLDRANNTWIKQNWSNPSNVDGYYIYAYDGEIYMSGSQWQNAYRFNPSTNTWVTTNKFGNIEGYDVWTDGTELYYNHGSISWIYDTTTSGWKDKTWPFAFNGHDVIKINGVYYIKSSASIRIYKWTGGDNFTEVSNPALWPSPFDNIWTDGTDTYYSLRTSSLKFQKWDEAQGRWINVTWESIPRVGNYVWSYGMHARDNHCKPILKSNLEF